MQRKETTIYDIANAAGVSAATVSRALKDHPSISKLTRQKVKKIAQEIGYRSNALASGLRTRRSKTIGVIVPRLDSNFMSTVLAGMEKAAVEGGYHLIIMQSFESKEKEAESAWLLFNHRVDGLIVSTTAPSDEIDHFNPFFKKNIPVVFFDRIPSQPDQYNWVAINNQKAAYAITEHLLKNGNHRILHITGDTTISAYKSRLDGYRQALDNWNINFNESLVWETTLGVEDGKKMAQRILQMNDLPEAVFVANDTCAITIMHYLKQNGLKIPEQIRITGFNNDPFSAFMTPGLTTVNYEGTKMGIESAKALIALLNSHDGEHKKINITLDFELIVRQSSLSENQNSQSL